MIRSTLALAAAMAVVRVQAEASPVTFTLVNGTYNDIALMAGAKNGTPLSGFQLTIDSAAVTRAASCSEALTQAAAHTLAMLPISSRPTPLPAAEPAPLRATARSTRN